MKTPVRPAPTDWAPDPPPPDDVVYLDFVQAHIPRQTRDGREWTGGGKQGPQAFAKVIVDGRDILVTPIQSGVLNPTWPDQPRANYRISPSADVRVELWDARAIKDRPICLKRVGSIQDEVSPSPVELVCEDTGTRIIMNISPGRPLMGLGLYYELLGAGGVRVTRVVEESPAARAGIVQGTRILLLQGKSVQELDALDIKSTINANARKGLDIELLLPDGTRKSVTLKEEAMYPLSTENLALQL